MLTTGAVVAGWIVAVEMPGWMRFAIALVTVGAAALALGSAFARDARLRWTGVRWQLLDPTVAASTPVDGDVRLAIDLGSLLLVRFVADGAGGRTTWLPLQRRGTETPWHALRCAVYAPRPGSGR
ncbi:MAG: hypothetical protein ABI809_02790 [Caldimonas sp.]